MKKSTLAVVSLFLLIYILPLGVRPVIIPDESRYAEIPREMIASGDWIVPHLNGLHYFEKPVLGYWLNAISMLTFGENAFAIRFSSALAAGLSALAVFFLCRKFATGYFAGILAAAALLTCPEVLAVGVFSVLDSILAFFLTGAMATFFYAFMEPEPRRQKFFLALFGIFCGLAFLTKGFLGLVIPTLVVVPFMLLEGRSKDLARMAWLPLITALLTILPWSLAVHQADSDFWHYFFWVEHVKRFTSQDAQHREPFWFFLPFLVGGALPWILFVPGTAASLIKTVRENSLVRFCGLWFLLPFLFFSASRGKLPTYILPCFPPLVILITTGLLQYLEKGRRRVFTAGALLLIFLTILLAAAMAVIQLTDLIHFKIFNSGETWKWIIALFAILSWTVLLILAVRERDFRRSLTFYCLAPVLFMFCGHFLTPDLTKERKAPEEFLIQQQYLIRPTTIIVTDEDLAPAICFFYKRADLLLLENAGEFDYGLKHDSARNRLLGIGEFKDFVNQKAPKTDIALITGLKNYTAWKNQIPAPSLEKRIGGYVFAQYTLTRNDSGR